MLVQLKSRTYSCNRKYTIQSIVCEASCHSIIQSIHHLVTLSLSHLVIQSLTWSLSHLVTSSTWSLGHLVTWSLGHLVTLVTWSLGHSVIQSTLLRTHRHTHNIRMYRSASQTNTEKAKYLPIRSSYKIYCIIITGYVDKKRAAGLLEEDDLKIGQASCFCSNPGGFINWRFYMIQNSYL